MVLFQAADAKLTLDRIATAPVLVAEVAKATGRHLEVSPTLSTEVLMVCVSNAGVSDVLAKLALAATATWEPMEGGMRLVPDGAARTLEASAERARRRKALDDGMRKKAETTKAQTPAGPEAAMAAMFTGGTGGVNAFVPMLDPAALAAMEDGDRIVFATRPTAAQLPLRGDPSRVVTDLIAKHNQQARSMAGSAGELPEAMSAMLKGPLGDRFRTMSQIIQAAPVKITVAASKGALGMFGESGLDIRLELRAYGANGAVILEEVGSVDTDIMAIAASMQPPKPKPIAATATPIVYSDEAKALASVSTPQNFQAGLGLGERAAIPPKLLAYLLNPEKHEPLALVPGEGLIALAKARRKPLVACLPDGAFSSILGNPAPKTVEEVEEALQKGPMRLVPDAEYLVVKAADPVRARRDRIDRAALGTLLRAAADHDAPSLDELAAYAVRSPEPARNALSMSVLSLFAPGSMDSLSGAVNWNSLRLYASLSPSQRTSLASGAHVPFNTIGQAGKKALGAMLYGAGGGLTVERNGVAPEDDIIATAMRTAMGGGAVDALDEPTEAAPNGLPAGGYLQAAVATETIIRPVTMGGAGTSTMGADELALIRLITTGPMAAQVGDAIRLPASARTGTRTTWSLRGYVAPTSYVTATLHDDRTPKDGKVVGMGELPADLQARIAQKTEKLRKSPIGAMMAVGAMSQPKTKP